MISIIIRIIAIIILSTITVNTISAQELKRRQKLSTQFHEDYYVLKSNKKIRHGQYVRFERLVEGNAILEMGFFDDNQKSGDWQIFYKYGSSLKETGTYRKDLKNGLWTAYFKKSKNTPEDMTELNQAITVTDSGVIDISTENLITSAKGVYLNNMKTGAWNYYDRDAVLVHKFNHSSDELLNSDENFNETIPYLGGIDHLNNYLIQLSLSEKKWLSDGDGEIIFEIIILEEQPSLEIISKEGNIKMKDILEEILSNLPDNWIKNFNSESYQSQLGLKFISKDNHNYSLLFFNNSN